MNADDLKLLPQFIEGSDCAMLRISSDDFGFSGPVYVRLSDVEALLAKTVCQGKVEYVSVGRGSFALYRKAKRNGWKLFAYSINNRMSGGWRGDSPYKCYYLKK